MDAKLSDLLHERTGLTLTGYRRIERGGNNRIYKLQTHENNELIAKIYFSGDRKQALAKLKAEFEALSFLHSNDIHCIPEPIAADFNHYIGIYEYLPGNSCESGLVSNEDLIQMADFLTRLHRLSKTPEAEVLAVASDSCLNTVSFLDAVHQRFQAIFRATAENPILAGIHRFLEHCFQPEMAAVFSEFKSKTRNAGLESKHNSHSCYTLSPSDFGVHNCLKSKTGKLFFIDFEYFGWDAASKMISDFFHHPSMQLNAKQMKMFLEYFIDASQMENLEEEIETVHKIVGLKWVLLFLNVCLPEVMARKQFARTITSQDEFVATQLLKAEDKLSKIKGFSPFNY